MYLHQRFDWVYKHIESRDELQAVLDTCPSTEDFIYGYDTETTGLHHMTAVPFLHAFGWLGFEGQQSHVYTLDVGVADDLMVSFLKTRPRVFAHNAKYDFHMVIQAGFSFEEVASIKWADSITVARLTTYSDIQIRMSLESLGQTFVHEDAKEAGKVIKELIKKKKLDLRREAKKADNPDADFDVNYLDIYMDRPDLMRRYAADDIVIMLTYLKGALPLVLSTQEKLFEQECKLIQAVAKMERVGLLVDSEYALKAKERVTAHRDKLWHEMVEAANKEFNVGQHEVIKKLFRDKWGIVLLTSDEKALKKVYKGSKIETARTVARNIIELRTIEKWISTYIDGKLSTLVNGRIYTSINNSGAVSGRVSCDMQQQPKEALSDIEGKTLYTEDGEELFHPRRMFIADPGTKLVFMDFSQMELRVQAYYTMMIMGGDLNLCRAYIPYKCTSVMTGEKFDYKNPLHLSIWDSGEWVKDEDNMPWEPVDLHDVTTFKAFPELNNDRKHPDFKHLRRLGKMCNFLKNYQGGVSAIEEQLDVSNEIAVILDKAYTESFPGVKDYQRWVANQFKKYRYVENLFGRRYYMQDLKWAYKGANYLIQGGCADLLKQKEIVISDYLKDYPTVKFVLPIHDELMFSIPDDQMDIIPTLHKMLQDVPEIPWVPMLSEIEVSSTNWADKELYHEK